MAISISPSATYVNQISSNTFDVTGGNFNLSAVSGNDVKITYLVDSVIKYVAGIDNSTTNDDWVLSQGTTLGTNNRIIIDGSSGDVSIPTLGFSSGFSCSISTADTAIFTATADLTTNDPVLTLSAPATDSATDPFQWNTANAIQWAIDNTARLRINDDGSMDMIGAVNVTGNETIIGNLSFDQNATIMATGANVLTLAGNMVVNPTLATVTTESSQMYIRGTTSVTGGTNDHRLLKVGGTDGGITINNGSNTHAQVASLVVNEPNITLTSGTVTNASTLYIAKAPTEGTNNYALYVDDGASKFDGTTTFVGDSNFESKVGIGVASPTYDLDIGATQTIRIANNADVDRVLTSDANGVATWVASSGGGGGAGTALALTLLYSTAYGFYGAHTH